MSANQIDRAMAHLREALEQELRPGIAKTRPVSLREDFIGKSHAAFRQAIDSMLAQQTSKRQIAREMDVDVHTLIDVYEGNRRLHAWMIAALPERGRRVFLAAALAWQDAERSGTDG